MLLIFLIKKHPKDKPISGCNLTKDTGLSGSGSGSSTQGNLQLQL
jgi:hypothetical protein